MGKLPGFFKVYFPSRSSEKMPFPLAYSSILGEAKPGRALLRNSNGQLWAVRLTKEGDTWYFTDGWKELLEEINVEAGDIFVFDYKGNSTFHFELLGNDRCSKDTSWTPFSDTTESESEGEEYEEVGEKYRSEESSKPSRAEDRIPRDEQKGKSISHEDAPPTHESGINNDAYHLLTDSDSDHEEDEYLAEKTSQPKRKKKGYKSQTTRKGHTTEEDIFQYGVISPPQNPYFVAKIWGRKPSDLCIPRDVIDKNKLELPEKLIILDERNRKWSADVRHWSDGRIWISQGWRAFCHWNFMKLEDRCICEFIRDGQQGLYVKACILRQGSWLPKATQGTQTDSTSVHVQGPREST